MIQQAGAETVRVRALDGLRAISILLVILNHTAGTAGAPRWLGPLGAALDAGSLGVRIFFVISGYLITSLLASEFSRTGTISLRAFYWRRTLRIFPPAYVFLAVLVMLTIAKVVPLTWKDLLAGATYTMNFYVGEWTPRQWSIAHLWSLAVEEQFYLLWPAALLMIGMRRAVWVLTGLLLAVPVVRVAALFTAMPPLLTALNPLLLYADWLGAGALIALLRPWLHQSPRYLALRARDSWALGLALSGLVAWTALGHWRVRELTSSGTIVAVAFAVDLVATERAGWAVRLLSLPTVVWIGRVSYSLYLWQELFCNRYALAPWTAFPVNIVLAFAFASVSYYAVERPVLAWRDRRRHASAG